MNKIAMIIGMIGLSFFQGHPLQAKNEEVSVTFDSFKDMVDAKGDKLDGTVSFVFANKGTKGVGKAIRGRINMNNFGKNDQSTCRMALLTAFIKMQERAKRDGEKRFVEVKTYAKNSSSDSAEKCLCAAGGVRLGTTVEGKYSAGK